MALAGHLAAPIVFAALAFAAWCVFLGGLAGIQQECLDAGRFSTATFQFTGCSKWFRFYWFIFAWEFVVVLGVFIMAATRRLPHSRLALLALTTIATTLYILAANALLDGIYGYSLGGAPLNRMRTAAAGAIMVAAFDALLLLALGTTPAPVGVDRVDKNVAYTTTAVPVGTTVAIPAGQAAV